MVEWVDMRDLWLPPSFQPQGIQQQEDLCFLKYLLLWLTLLDTVIGFVLRHLLWLRKCSWCGFGCLDGPMKVHRLCLTVISATVFHVVAPSLLPKIHIHPTTVYWNIPFCYPALIRWHSHYLGYLLWQYNMHYIIENYGCHRNW